MKYTGNLLRNTVRELLSVARGKMRWSAAPILVVLGAGVACAPDSGGEASVFDDQVQALERAREVEHTLEERAAGIAGRLDTHTGGEDDEEQ